MSYFNMVCDSCGRDVCGCNIVNGMKFCAKCYQETFGNQQKYIDMLNKESSELLVNSLAEKDKQIAELQKQLKSQPAEIVEKIRQLLGLKLEYKHNENVPILKICNQINEVLDTILKEYQK